MERLDFILSLWATPVVKGNSGKKYSFTIVESVLDEFDPEEQLDVVDACRDSKVLFLVWSILDTAMLNSSLPSFRIFLFMMQLNMKMKKPCVELRMVKM